MFIEIANTHINLNNVKTLTTYSAGTKRYIQIDFIDGKKSEFEINENFALDEEIFDIIPCNEDFKIVNFIGGKDCVGKDCVWVMPVIAFKYYKSSPPIPIASDGDASGRYGIILPDGRVDIPNDRTVDSLDAYIEYCLSSM
ncbi:hypothetical protein [Ancylobacter sp. SL191]|uniref:hypothetical protein n=1 Tax=Ancylobacter sp. SL191 TaxID=2995166 RepID=UPI00226F9F2F|nr:hypothetical protein [Ancylobacter sp. SL191]WAC25752.1 hypothetical protein OU996_11990 [Ancylobacter sp. SL191]